MMKALYILLFTLFGAHGALGQVLMTGHINERLLQGRVKQVEEFMARFNGEEDWLGNAAEYLADTLMRARYLRTLFDHGRFPFKGKRLNEQAERFIRYVTLHDCRLSFTDTTWTAEVNCQMVYGGKTFPLTLRLHTVRVDTCQYRWEVGEVGGEVPDTVRSILLDTRLSPVEHEYGFTGLLPITMKGGLRVSKVTGVRYIFHTVPGYAFTIERIERKNSYNTGWLITSLRHFP